MLGELYKYQWKDVVWTDIDWGTLCEDIYGWRDVMLR